MYTVVPVADVDWRLICLLNPRVLHGPPRRIYVGYGKYSLLTSYLVPRAHLGVTSPPKSIVGILNPAPCGPLQIWIPSSGNRHTKDPNS